MNVANAPVPTSSTRAVRRPAMITGRAKGSSTRSRVCSGDMPMPRAASTTVGSTPRSPASVLASTGRNA